MSYYDDLEVQPSASQADIDHAYRVLSKKFHPDSNPGEEKWAAKEFKRVHDAFEFLRDPEVRAAYDETLRRKQRPNHGPSGVPPVSGGLAAAQEPRASSRPEPQPESPKTAIRRLVREYQFIALVIGGLLVVLAGIVTVVNRPPSAEDIVRVKQSNAATKAAELEEQERLRKAKEAAELAALKHAQDVATAKKKLKDLWLEGQKVLDLVRSLDEELAAWDKNVVPLLSNAQGKSIAADDDRVRAFDEHWNVMQVKKADAKTVRAGIAILLEPIEKESAKAEPVWRADTGVSDELKVESGKIRTLIEEVRGPRRRIEILIETAAREGKASAFTLSDAIKDLAVRTAKAESDEIARIRREGERNMQAAKSEKAKQEEVEKVDRVKAKKEAMIAAQKEATEKEALTKKAKSPSTRKLLAFFFTPGYVQPLRQMGAEKRPISYSRLDAIGALAPSLDGQEKLLEVLLDYGDKERPLWTEKITSVALLTPAKREKLIEMQRALIELGPTLVELELLAP